MAIVSQIPYDKPAEVRKLWLKRLTAEGDANVAASGKLHVVLADIKSSRAKQVVKYMKTWLKTGFKPTQHRAFQMFMNGVVGNRPRRTGAALPAADELNKLESFLDPEHVHPEYEAKDADIQWYLGRSILDADDKPALWKELKDYAMVSVLVSPGICVYACCYWRIH